MRKLFFVATVLTAFLLAACKPSSDLTKMALSRLPSVVTHELSEKENIRGEIKLADVKTVFDSDSLCIVQCVAVCTDSLGAETRLPLRYVFVRDAFMSLAKGRPAYNEGLFGANLLSEKEIEDMHKVIASGGPRSYDYYVGVTLPVEGI